MRRNTFWHPLLTWIGSTTPSRDNWNEESIFTGYFMYNQHSTDPVGKIVDGRTCSPFGDAQIIGGVYDADKLVMETRFRSTKLGEVITKYELTNPSGDNCSYEGTFQNAMLGGRVRFNLNLHRELAPLSMIHPDLR